ncbi:hypothetical protein AnigIFM59636_009680 [Aspergillus niger]|nr:hypothetical protein AnigIFM59636_009680 [Aspergillus niger]
MALGTACVQLRNTRDKICIRVNRAIHGWLYECLRGTPMFPRLAQANSVEQLRKKPLPIDKVIKAVLSVELALRFTYHSWGHITIEAAADPQRTQIIKASETLIYHVSQEKRTH